MDPSLLQCPAEGVSDEGCDYRGPATNVNVSSNYGDSDPVGADVDGNHGEGRGGNVLFKSGDIRTVSAGDPAWERAARKTSGGTRAVPGAILTRRIPWELLLLVLPIAAVWVLGRRP